MKTFRVSMILSIFLFTCISNFRLQPVPGNKTIFGVYEGTTPCTETVSNLLQLPADFKCEMMKWKLSLYTDADKNIPSSFDLICSYGAAKPRTPGLAEGARILELRGKCRITHGIPKDDKATVYELAPDNSKLSLSFFQADQNILHLLAPDNTLMVGTAAWSYTLTRKEPVVMSDDRFVSKPYSSIRLTSSTSIVGTFEGRSPCDKALKDLQGITSAECGIVKLQLTLFQDSLTHSPTNFRLKTIYVGFGDNNTYSATGSWKILQGTIADPAAIVYQLQPFEAKSQTPILLQKGDDNILFFLDSNTRLLTGTEYCSYTLNRRTKG